MEPRLPATLPRRTAHALHALLTTVDDINSPAKASEVVIYDAEALSATATGRALAHGCRLGYCFQAGDGCWWPTNDLYEARTELEDRFLADTGESS